VNNIQTVILAGGLGTRLGPAWAAIPKSLVPIGGKPLLEHQLLLLKRYGLQDVILLTGHLSEKIEQFCGDGSRWGMRITCVCDSQPLGTAGAVRAISEQLSGDFVVLYGDVMLNMNLQRLLAFHKERMSDCTLVLHPNNHPFDSDLVAINAESRITGFFPKPHHSSMCYRNLVNAAVYVLSPRILPYITKDTMVDFGKDVFPRLPDTLRLYGYTTREYLKDIGTPERREEVEQDYRSGRIERANFDYKRPAVFLDRDGVINEEVGLLHRPEQFALLPHAAAGVRKINASDYLAVVISNQSVIARNLCTIAELERIHNTMETLLGQERAKLDGIYYCPHHPDAGYPEENPQYKINCTCRKPKTGLVERAARDLNIALEDSFFVGDAETDILCGHAAGLTTIGLRCGRGCKDSAVEPDYFFDDLYEAACFITEDPYHDVYHYLETAFSQSGKRPFIIAIGGNSRSGKSVLARYLAKKLRRQGEKVLSVALDNWLLPKQRRNPSQDVLARFQIQHIETDLQRLFRGEDIYLRKYDQFLREGTDTVVHYRLGDATIVIIDGVVALAAASLRSMADLKIFCSIDSTLLAKRVTRFYLWKGLDQYAIEELLKERQRSEYDIIKENDQYADIIVNALDYSV